MSSSCCSLCSAPQTSVETAAAQSLRPLRSRCCLMVSRMGWGGSRRQRGRWGDLGPSSVPLLPMALPLSASPCRGLGGGRISVFSLSPVPRTRSCSSSLFPPASGSPCPVTQEAGASQLPYNASPAPATPPTQTHPTMTPTSASPSWGSHSTPPLASVTPPPSCRCPQDHPGLRIGPLIPEQDYERLEDCDPEGSQDSPLHGEDHQPLLHVPEGLRGKCGLFGRLSGLEVQAGLGLHRGTDHQGDSAKS